MAGGADGGVTFAGTLLCLGLHQEDLCAFLWESRKGRGCCVGRALTQLGRKELAGGASPFLTPREGVTRTPLLLVALKSIKNGCQENSSEETSPTLQ